MLRRVENVQVSYQRDLWGMLTGRYKILLEVGRKNHLSAPRVGQLLNHCGQRPLSRSPQVQRATG